MYNMYIYVYMQSTQTKHNKLDGIGIAYGDCLGESRASFCLLPAGKIFNPMTFARRSGSCQASTYECVGGLRVQDIPSVM